MKHEFERLAAYLSATMLRFVESLDAKVSVETARRRLDRILKPIQQTDIVGLDFPVDDKGTILLYPERMTFFVFVDWAYRILPVQIEQSHLPTPPPNYFLITAAIAQGPLT